MTVTKVQLNERVEVLESFHGVSRKKNAAKSGTTKKKGKSTMAAKKKSSKKTTKKKTTKKKVTKKKATKKKATKKKATKKKATKKKATKKKATKKKATKKKAAKKKATKKSSKKRSVSRRTMADGSVWELRASSGQWVAVKGPTRKKASVRKVSKKRKSTSKTRKKPVNVVTAKDILGGKAGGRKAGASVTAKWICGAHHLKKAERVVGVWAILPATKSNGPRTTKMEIPTW
jgi:hypothetical protein